MVLSLIAVAMLATGSGMAVATSPTFDTDGTAADGTSNITVSGAGAGETVDVDVAVVDDGADDGDTLYAIVDTNDDGYYNASQDLKISTTSTDSGNAVEVGAFALNDSLDGQYDVHIVEANAEPSDGDDISTSGKADEIATDGITVAPTISSAVTADIAGDGNTDHITVTFSEPIDDDASTINTNTFSLTDGSIDKVWTGATDNDSKLQIAVSGLNGTDATPDITLETGTVDVKDSGGNTMENDQNFTATNDGAAPAATRIITLDANEDGNVDAANIIVSEPVDDATLTQQAAGDFEIGGLSADTISTNTYKDDGGVASSTADDDRFSVAFSEASKLDEIPVTDTTPQVTMDGAGITDTSGNPTRPIADGDVNESTNLQYGDLLTTELNASDAFADAYVGYYDKYTFYGDRGDVIDAELRPPGTGTQSADLHAGQLILLDPQGREVLNTSAAEGAASIDRHELSTTGAYTLIATTEWDDPQNAYDNETDAKDDRFEYSLELAPTDPPTRELSPGDSVNSKFDTGDATSDQYIGYHEKYSFTAENGDVVTLEMRPSGVAHHDAEYHAANLTLIAPDGDTWTSEDSAGSAQLERFAIDETGVYMVVAGTKAAADTDVYDSESAARNDTFSYEIRFYEGYGSAESISDGQRLDTSLTSGDRYQDEANGYYDTYTFSGETGDVVSLEMRPAGVGSHDSENHATELRLISPDGDVVATKSAASGAAQLERYTLKQTGSYRVIATTNTEAGVYAGATAGKTDTFSYQLRLYEGYGNTLSIDYGEQQSERRGITDNYQDSLGGFYDIYTFQGESGDEITVEARPGGIDGHDSTEHAAQLKLIDPEGNIQNSSDATGSAQLEGVTLNQTGTHKIIVTTPGESSPAYSGQTAARADTFDYSLRLYQDYGETTSIEYGDRVDATLEEADNYRDDQTGYFDSYTFNGSDGDVINLELRPLGIGSHDSTEHAAQIKLITPTGTIHTSADASGSAQLHRITLDETGTYRVIATTESDDSEVYGSGTAAAVDTFSYQLRLYEAYGTTTDINYGEHRSANLSQSDNFQDELTGYYDVYTFDGADGDVVNLEMRPLDVGGHTLSEHSASLTIIKPDGSVATSSDTRGSAQLEQLTLQQSGTYTVIASTEADGTYASPAAARQDRFPYELRLYADYGPTKKLSYGETVDAELSRSDRYLDTMAGYYDSYMFDASDGDVVSVEMRPLGVGSHALDEHAAQLYLIKPNGEIQTTTDPSGAAQLEEITLHQSGTYRVIATTEWEDSSVYPAQNESYADTFSYSLRLYEGYAPEQVIGYNQSVTESLSTDDNFLDGQGGYYDAYSLPVTKGDVFSVKMSVEDDDNHAGEITIITPSGSVYESSTQTAAPINGTYTIIVSTDTDAAVYDSASAAKQDTMQYLLNVTGPANNPPDVSAYAETDSINVGNTVYLHADATDPNGEDLTYEWTQQMGSVPDPEVDLTGQNSPIASFTAPNVDQNETLTFTVSVTDESGARSNSSVSVLVTKEGTTENPGDPGDINGNGKAAKDLNEDSLYEDVNGNSAFDIGDVQALFANRKSDSIQNNVTAFDFNNNSEIDIGDVQTLFVEYQNS